MKPESLPPELAAIVSILRELGDGPLVRALPLSRIEKALDILDSAPGYIWTREIETESEYIASHDH
jgi:hypothetical protein